MQEDISDKTLYSIDGNFICAADHALEIAQMISNMESAYSVAKYKFEVTDLLGQYFHGELDIKEINEVLYEEWPEAFPGLNKKEAMDKEPRTEIAFRTA